MALTDDIYAKFEGIGQMQAEARGDGMKTDAIEFCIRRTRERTDLCTNIPFHADKQLTALRSRIAELVGDMVALNENRIIRDKLEQAMRDRIAELEGVVRELLPHAVDKPYVGAQQMRYYPNNKWYLECPICKTITKFDSFAEWETYQKTGKKDFCTNPDCSAVRGRALVEQIQPTEASDTPVVGTERPRETQSPTASGVSGAVGDKPPTFDAPSCDPNTRDIREDIPSTAYPVDTTKLPEEKP